MNCLVNSAELSWEWNKMVQGPPWRGEHRQRHAMKRWTSELGASSETIETNLLNLQMRKPRCFRLACSLARLLRAVEKHDPVSVPEGDLSWVPTMDLWAPPGQTSQEWDSGISAEATIAQNFLGSGPGRGGLYIGRENKVGQCYTEIFKVSPGMVVWLILSHPTPNFHSVSRGIISVDSHWKRWVLPWKNVWVTQCCKGWASGNLLALVLTPASHTGQTLRRPDSIKGCHCREAKV